MELKEFKPREISLSEDYVGFPSIHEELRDIVNYLGHLIKLTQDGKDDYRRMLSEAECGCLFLGRTGAGKTHALHCVVNEAAKLGYHPLDGSLMLGKSVVDPRDVRGNLDLRLDAHRRTGRGFLDGLMGEPYPGGLELLHLLAAAAS